MNPSMIHHEAFHLLLLIACLLVESHPVKRDTGIAVRSICIGEFPCKTEFPTNYEQDHFEVYSFVREWGDGLDLEEVKVLEELDFRRRGNFGCEPSCRRYFNVSEKFMRLADQKFDACMLHSSRAQNIPNGLVCFFNRTGTPAPQPSTKVPTTLPTTLPTATLPTATLPTEENTPTEPSLVEPASGNSPSKAFYVRLSWQCTLLWVLLLLYSFI